MLNESRKVNVSVKKPPVPSKTDLSEDLDGMIVLK